MAPTILRRLRGDGARVATVVSSIDGREARRLGLKCHSIKGGEANARCNAPHQLGIEECQSGWHLRVRAEMREITQAMARSFTPIQHKHCGAEYCVRIESKFVIGSAAQVFNLGVAVRLARWRRLHVR